MRERAEQSGVDHILGVIWGSNAPKSEGRQIHGMEPMLGDDLFCNTTFQKFAIGQWIMIPPHFENLSCM